MGRSCHSLTISLQSRIRHSGVISNGEINKMSMLSADILSSDFSHKLPKRVARVDGCPVYTAVHTFGNQYGEIRCHTLTFTKSLKELDQPISGMLKSLK